MDLFDLTAVLTLDTSKYETGLTGALGAAKRIGSGIGSALKTATLVTGALVAAGTAVTGAFVSAAKKTADYGDKVDKMSQKIGISAEAYQKWNYVMERSDVNIDSMKMGMKTLSQQVEKGSDAFQKLGISQEEVKKLSQEELFEKTVKGLAEMEQGTERNVLASQLLGRAGADMAPLLNEGSDAIEEQMEIAEKYGMVMPDAAVKASAAFEDSLTTMQMTFTGLKNRLMGEFLPAMTQVTDGMAKLFAGDDSGAEDVAKGIEGVLKKVSEAVPKIAKIAVDISKSLATAFVDDLRKRFSGTDFMQVFNDAVDYVVENVPAMIEQFAQMFSDNAPILAEKGTEMILKLSEGLIEALPQLISAAGLIVNGLLKVFVGIPALLLAKGMSAIGSFILGILKKANSAATAGAKVISSLVSGLSKGIGKVSSMAKKLATSAINSLKNGFGNVTDIGMNIVKGIGRGITNGTNWIKGQIKSFVGNVKSFLKRLFGIKSPSTWARDSIGKMIDAGLALGITDNSDMVDDAMNDLIPSIESNGSSLISSVGAGASKILSPIININSTVNGAENPRLYGDELADEMLMRVRAL